MTSHLKKQRFDQFRLRQMFTVVTLLGVLFAFTRLALLCGLLSRAGMAAFGCVGILGSMMYLLADHQIQIQNGTRQQMGLPAGQLFIALGGLTYAFLWLLGHALALVH